MKSLQEIYYQVYYGGQRSGNETNGITEQD